MTGFGRASVEAADRRLRVEIRSVNHRGLDIKVRGSELDAYCEVEVARTIRGVGGAGRGHRPRPRRIERRRRRRSTRRACGTCIEVLERLRQELEIEQPVDLATVGAFMMAAGAGVQLEGESLWQALRPAVTGALAELVATRRREGDALAADLEEQPRAARGAGVQPAPGDGDAARQVRAPPGRPARRCCAARRAWTPAASPRRWRWRPSGWTSPRSWSASTPTSEHVRELLAGAGAVGRKLDFVIQEIGRELNTIGSKVAGRGRGRRW